MAEILKDLSEQTLITAIEANLLEMGPDLFANIPHADFHNEPDITWFTTGISHPLFNGVFRAQISSEATKRIASIKSHFQSKRLPMLWWVGPSAQPACLGKLLQAQGLIRLDDVQGMAIDLRALENFPTPPNLQIKKVATVEDLQEWIQPVAKAFEFPKGAIAPYVIAFSKLGLTGNWHHYIATSGEKTIGASSMFLGAGVAGIYNVATLPKARRRGVGTALTLASLQEAQKMGYTISVLQSSKVGLGVYHRLGFKDYCKIGHYLYLPNWSQRTLLRIYNRVHRST